MNAVCRYFLLWPGLLALMPLAGAEAADRPNILFAIADDVSFPHMGAYGCDWVETPAFDRVATEGLLFTNAYTPNAKCAPSRANILTGRNSWQLEAAANHWCYFPAKFRVYPEVLADHRYHVGYTGKGWAPGIAKTAEGAVRHLAGAPWQKQRSPAPADKISSRDYAANFKDFLDATPPETPFCFWYGGHEPHRGYEYGAGIKRGGKSIEEIDRVPGYWPDNETVRTDMLDYAFEIEHFDRHLGRMLEVLRQRGDLKNTLVVVTSDNGAPFPRVKGQEYEASNHLPLAIMWPAGIRDPGRTIDSYVSFIDFAPTFLDVAGIPWSESGMASTSGKSLLPIFKKTRAAIRDHVLIGKERHDVGRPHDWGYPIRGIVKNGWLYLMNYEPTRWPAGNPETGYLNTDGGPTKTIILEGRLGEQTHKYWKLCFGKRPAEELYQIAKDPDCLKNLADSPEHAARKQALHDQLMADLAAQNDPRVQGRGFIFEQYPYADKSHRNFYERYMSGEDIKAGWVNPTDFQRIEDGE